MNCCARLCDLGSVIFFGFSAALQIAGVFRHMMAIDDEFLNIYSVADTYLPWLVGVPFPLGT
jgi:hypothetical protein